MPVEGQSQLTDLPRVSILGGLLKRIGNYDPTSFKEKFEARLILQKTIYLMQAFGLNVGYSYSWYLGGPYSVGLSHDAYKVADRFDEAPHIKFVENDAEKRFGKFLLFLSDKKNDDKWLEIASSTHFLHVALSMNGKDEIYEEVKRKMRALPRKEFEESWNYLVKWGLLRQGA